MPGLSFKNRCLTNRDGPPTELEREALLGEKKRDGLRRYRRVGRMQEPVPISRKLMLEAEQARSRAADYQYASIGHCGPWSFGAGLKSIEPSTRTM